MVVTPWVELVLVSRRCARPLRSLVLSVSHRETVLPGVTTATVLTGLGVGPVVAPVARTGVSRPIRRRTSPR